MLKVAVLLVLTMPATGFGWEGIGVLEEHVYDNAKV
jgi:hypothetical protein